MCQKEWNIMRTVMCCFVMKMNVFVVDECSIIVMMNINRILKFVLSFYHFLQIISLYQFVISLFTKIRTSLQ